MGVPRVYMHHLLFFERSTLQTHGTRDTRFMPRSQVTLTRKPRNHITIRVVRKPNQTTMCHSTPTQSRLQIERS